MEVLVGPERGFKKSRGCWIGSYGLGRVKRISLRADSVLRIFHYRCYYFSAGLIIYNVASSTQSILLAQGDIKKTSILHGAHA